MPGCACGQDKCIINFTGPCIRSKLVLPPPKIDIMDDACFVSHPYPHGSQPSVFHMRDPFGEKELGIEAQHPVDDNDDNSDDDMPDLECGSEPVHAVSPTIVPQFVSAGAPAIVRAWSPQVPTVTRMNPLWAHKFGPQYLSTTFSDDEEETKGGEEEEPLTREEIREQSRRLVERIMRQRELENMADEDSEDDRYTTDDFEDDVDTDETDDSTTLSVQSGGRVPVMSPMARAMRRSLPVGVGPSRRYAPLTL